MSGGLGLESIEFLQVAMAEACDGFVEEAHGCLVLALSYESPGRSVPASYRSEFAAAAESLLRSEAVKACARYRSLAAADSTGDSSLHAVHAAMSPVPVARIAGPRPASTRTALDMGAKARASEAARLLTAHTALADEISAAKAAETGALHRGPLVASEAFGQAFAIAPRAVARTGGVRRAVGREPRACAFGAGHTPFPATTA